MELIAKSGVTSKFLGEKRRNEMLDVKNINDFVSEFPPISEFPFHIGGISRKPAQIRCILQRP